MHVTGSIQPKRGIYQMVVRVPDIDGVPRQKTKSTGIPAIYKTKRENDAARKKAEKLLAKWVAELEESGVPISKDTLLKRIDEWIERQRFTVRENTWESYVGYANNHIKPFFAPKKLLLADVTPRHIQQFVDYEYGAGKSAESIKKFLVVLNGVFREAIGFREINYNPCGGVKLPKGKKFVGKAYTVEQANELIDAIEDDPIKPAVMLGLFLGLRRSEVAGLRWADIDFKNNIVHIQNTVVRYSKILEEEHTKSSSSRRDLYLPRSLRKYLLGLKLEQQNNKVLYGDEYADSGHVCQWPDGTQYSPDYITRGFRRCLEKKSLPIIRFHDLRHTAGSILYNSGHTGKQIQQFLGHEDITTTLNTYTHITNEHKQETADKIDDLLGNSETKKSAC